MISPWLVLVIGLVIAGASSLFWYSWYKSWPVCVCKDCIRCGCNQPWRHHARRDECERINHE
jgi:hypothetical protein